MISAALGMVIMSAATVSMLIALNITTKELKKAGRYYPSSDERKFILENAKFKPVEIKTIEDSIDQLDLGIIEN